MKQDKRCKYHFSEDILRLTADDLDYVTGQKGKLNFMNLYNNLSSESEGTSEGGLISLYRTRQQEGLFLRVHVE